MSDLFIDDADLKELTGCSFKEKQIEQLRKMGIPFFVNANGRAKVTRSAIEGSKQAEQPKQGWKPAVLQGNRKAA